MPIYSLNVQTRYLLLQFEEIKNGLFKPRCLYQKKIPICKPTIQLKPIWKLDAGQIHQAKRWMEPEIYWIYSFSFLQNSNTATKYEFYLWNVLQHTTQLKMILNFRKCISFVLFVFKVTETIRCHKISVTKIQIASMTNHCQL